MIFTGVWLIVPKLSQKYKIWNYEISDTNYEIWNKIWDMKFIACSEIKVKDESKSPGLYLLAMC